MSMQHENFAARVARIQAGQGVTKTTVFVGMDQSFVMTGADTIRKPSAAERHSNASYPVTLVGAFLLGLFSVAIGRYALFQVNGISSQNPDVMLEWVLNGAIGIMLSFALGQIFRLHSKIHLVMQVLGVLAMACTFHNLVHLAPQLFVPLFSEEWVQGMLANTVPKSLLFRGAFFVL